MQFLKLSLLVSSLILVVHSAFADVVEVPSLTSRAKVLSLFAVKDPRKTTAARARADLIKLLAPLNLTPCMVANDRGARVACSDGNVTITSNHLYTYNMHINFPTVVNQLRSLDSKKYKGVKLPDGVTDAWAVNFLPPPTDGISPCTGACNQTGAVTIQFGSPVFDFGVDVDNGSTTQLTQTMNIIVNGEVLPKELPLGVTRIKVQSIDPLTGTNTPIYSVTLQPMAGATGAFILDRVAYTAIQ